MKAESIELAGQKEICHQEKQRVYTDLEFSSWFSTVVPACLFAGFVFTGSRLV